MLSYAQNFEDVLLNRAFGGKADGFYIDVGGYHPTKYSVSAWFHRIGWKGITVEPVPELHALFLEKRPGAINLNCALGEVEGEAQINILGDTGLSSLDPQSRELAKSLNLEPRQLPVKVKTLAQICRQHVTSPIDFMKIDVEGFERQVIAGGDWKTYRPKVVVVEATRPNSPIPSHEGWEPLLLAEDYLFAWFDGLNRFYVAKEESALIPVLALPPNVFDNFHLMPIKPEKKKGPWASIKRLLARLTGRKPAA